MPDHFHWQFHGRVGDLPFHASLRKATTMMRMLIQGLGHLQEQYTTEDWPAKSVSTFIGSLHGEVEPTLNFLKGLAQQNVSRPFLFQNSLHHSTIGFASQCFPWIGASYSLCCVRAPQAEILQAGMLQVESAASLLMVHAESFPQELAEISRFDCDHCCEILFLRPEAVASVQKLKRPQSFREVTTFLKSFGGSCDRR
jgi:hypothetical protein